MGCDMTACAEKKLNNGEWEQLDFKPFDWRSYGMYGFLAGVRNYSAVTQIAPCRGLPDDGNFKKQEEKKGNPWIDYDENFCHSWLTVKELADFDYDAIMEDRRVTINNNGGCTAAPGGGKLMTYRDFLGKKFFEDIEKLKEIGADRIVFWFSN